MAPIQTSRRYPYQRWQFALAGAVLPAAYSAATLSALAGSVAAAFLNEVPETAGPQFLILLLFTLLRYGSIGAVAGWLHQRGLAWTIGAGTLVGVVASFIANIFLDIPFSAGQFLFVLVETLVLSALAALLCRWINRYPARRAIAVGLFIYLGILTPVLLGNDYRIGVVTEAYYLAILASSWALLAGVGGQFSFATMAFMAIGAYTSGLLGRDLGVPPLPGIITGTIAAGIVGFVIGVLCLPLRRAYLALFTIAFSEILRIVIVTEFQYTEGSNGLQLQRLFPFGSGFGDYYAMLLLLVISLALMYALANSRFGMFWRAIREDQEAAAAMGVDVVRYKLMLFVITSMIAGLAGATFFHTITIIVPTNLELLLMSTVIAMAVIGSLEILLGAAIGAFVLHISLELLREIVLPGWTVDLLANAGVVVDARIQFGTWRFVLFGLLLMLTLRFARNGLLYPVFQRFGGSQEVRQATVAKRQQSVEREQTEVAK
jgi:branched-chain amino acid transport system permease protein